MADTKSTRYHISLAPNVAAILEEIRVKRGLTVSAVIALAVTEYAREEVKRESK